MHSQTFSPKALHHRNVTQDRNYFPFWSHRQGGKMQPLFRQSRLVKFFFVIILTVRQKRFLALEIVISIRIKRFLGSSEGLFEKSLFGVDFGVGHVSTFFLQWKWSVLTASCPSLLRQHCCKKKSQKKERGHLHLCFLYWSQSYYCTSHLTNCAKATAIQQTHQMFLGSNSQDVPKIKRLLLLSVVWEIVVGGFFWLWAVFNVATRGFDAGIISFLFAVCAGVLGAWTLRAPSRINSVAYLVLLIVAHILVTLNWIGGAKNWNTGSKMGPSGFRIYCSFFACVWGLLGIFFGLIANCWRCCWWLQRSSVLVDPT